VWRVWSRPSRLLAAVLMRDNLLVPMAVGVAVVVAIRFVQ
jgi:hypothetical protein